MERLLRLPLPPLSIPGVVASLIAVGGVATIVGGIGASVRGSTAVAVALGVSFATASALPLLARRLAGRGNWFHPLFMPVSYVTFVLLAPLAYVMATQRAVAGVRPGDVSLPLVLALTLTIAGFLGGILASLWVVAPSGGEEIPRKWDRVLRAGRAILVVAIVMRAYSTARGLGIPYGKGSVDFGIHGTIQTVTDFLTVIGPALVVVAQVRLRGAIAGSVDLILFGVFCIITLIAGSRGELLPPLIFALWVYHSNVRRIPLKVVLVACVVVALVFQAVQAVRAGDSPLATPRAGIERTLTSLGVPMQVTSLTTGNVPSLADYRLGETYVESVKRQIPGVIAVKLWGPPSETGTFALRRIIGFNTPDAGLGFALPAESYLNFGVAGTALIALLIGLLFGYAYQKQTGVSPSRAVHVLYGFLIATLPLSLRADAVFQIKSVLYPMIGVAMILGACRVRGSRVTTTPAPNCKRVRLLGGR